MTTPQTDTTRCAECNCQNGGDECTWIVTPQTDAPTLQERLREDVFYGEERMYKMRKHNPLHMEVHDALDAHEATIAALVEAGDALARQAFCTMTGGHGHLIDDMVAAIALAKALK